MQRQRDDVAGLNTAGYVTGYQGSPLATVDLTMASAAKALHAARVVVQPAVNEELAASAILGTQQVPLDPDARYDGVFGMWYGKAPGVDRAADALNICNHSGVARMAACSSSRATIPAGKSSSVPNDSEHVLVHCKLPILSPFGVQEYLDMGILGWAMSRYSGSWVSMRCLTDTASSSAAVDARWDRLDIRRPPTSSTQTAGSSGTGPSPSTSGSCARCVSRPHRLSREPTGLIVWCSASHAHWRS